MLTILRNLKLLLLALVVLSTLTIVPRALALPDQTENSLRRAPILLGRSEQRILRFEKVKRYSIGNRKVVRPGQLPPAIARSDQDAILLKAVQVGKTDLWVWNQAGQLIITPVQVVDWKFPKISAVALTLAHNLQEVEVIPNDRGLLLHGQYQSLSEAKVIQKILAAAPKEVHAQVHPTSQYLNRVMTELEEWKAAKKQAHLFSFEPTEFGIAISGQMPNGLEKQKVLGELRAIHPLIDDQLQIENAGHRTVYFRVYLLEIHQSAFSKFGLQWPGSLGGQLSLPGAALSLNDLEFNLNALSGKGHLQLLSQPEITVRAPGEATLFAGGELPVQDRSRYQSKTQWKNFGLTLKINVTEVTAVEVKADIVTEVSDLDESIGNSDIPGIRKNHLSTQIQARFGEPLFMSGLIQESDRKRLDGIPWIQKIPILGSLFSSENYQNRQSELVAILVPHKKLPKKPMDRLGVDYPLGPTPPPREWISLNQMRVMRADPIFPWNLFEPVLSYEDDL